MKKLLSLVLALIMVLGCMSFASAEEVITVNVWSFTDELEGILNNYFIPTHPNIKINYTLYSTAEFFQEKLPTIMASAPLSEDAPDVFALEADYAKYWVNSDYTADLHDIGFTDEELAQAVPAVIDFARNPDGVPKGVSWQCTPGALMYRASLAEKYLGVTTPEEMQELVADWDTFLETAEELNEASEGAVKMFNSIGDITKPFLYNRESGWVVDGKLVIDPVMIDMLEMAKYVEEENLYNKGSQWAETWFYGMANDTTMCYFLPTWGLHYTLKPNCGGKKVGEGTYGDWAMCAGPVGYSWGGTWLGASAPKVAEMDDAKKAAVKEVIRFCGLDEDFLYQYAQDSGDFVSNIKSVERVLADGGTPNDFLGGQDHYSIFAQSSLLINASTTTGYDGVLNDKWSSVCVTPYQKGEIDMETALNAFIDEVAAAYAEVDVTDARASVATLIAE